MERNMRINEDVMRYLTIRIDALDPEPSVVMQSRGSRDSRGRGEYRSRDGERGEGRRDGTRDAPRADAPKDDGKAAAASATGAASVENSDSNAKSGAE